MAVKGTRKLTGLTAPQAQLVDAALRQWSKAKLIDPDLVSDLRATIQVVPEEYSFIWQKFAKYAFRLAIFSLAAALVSFQFGQGRFYKKTMKRILHFHIGFRVVITIGIALAVHRCGCRRSLAKPRERHLNEAIHCVGALVLALAALQLGQYCERSDIRGWVLISLISAYGVIALIIKSNFIWSCGSILLGALLYAISGYTFSFSIVLLGLIMIIASYFMQYSRKTMELWSTTRIWGLLYFFIALWVLSEHDFFFGTDKPGRYGQILYTLAFLCAASFSIWHGLRFANSTTKFWGLTFLCLYLVRGF
ncbi:hypothetical protein GGR54DRAFT_625666 [Hypoxylon sp. NC1633]|nr:hypothetical protein GGR54DRAFT_625666 [Hypoxylon sp. NC1633]